MKHLAEQTKSFVRNQRTHRDLARCKLPCGAERATDHLEARRIAAVHGTYFTVFIAKHFPFLDITSQTETTMTWPKACQAFCQPKENGTL